MPAKQKPADKKAKGSHLPNTSNLDTQESEHAYDPNIDGYDPFQGAGSHMDEL
jgi:hypothetical protein